MLSLHFPSAIDVTSPLQDEWPLFCHDPSSEHLQSEFPSISSLAASLTSDAALFLLHSAVLS